ncbi:CARDB domain-containing protein [Nanoarchaeota archaeon]
MKAINKTIMILLMVVALSGVVAAQECQGTLSAPNKQVYVGTDFNVTYFNAETNVSTDVLTFGYDVANVNHLAGANPVTPLAIDQEYAVIVEVTTAGTYLFNISIQGSTNCSKNMTVNVLDPAEAPIIVAIIDDLSGLVVGQPVNFDLDLYNAGGDAFNVTGYVVSNSGSAISPVGFLHLGIANSTTETSSHTLTPEYCGVDAVTGYVTEIHDANGEDIGPVQVMDMFVVTGSDDAFTTVSTPASVNNGDLAAFGFTVENIGNMDTTNVVVDVLVDNVSVGTVNLGALVVNQSASSSVSHDTTGMSAGTHDVSYVVVSDNECQSVNNQIDETFDVVGGPVLPFCGDGNVDAGEDCDGANLNGETCASVGSWTGGTLSCNSCSFVTSLCTTNTAGGSSGGGGGGSGGSRIFYLDLSEDKPEVTLPLRNGDTVKYEWDDKDYSFIIRNVYSDRLKFGVSESASYKTYEMMSGTGYELNLDDGSAADLGVEPDNKGSSTDITFSLLGIEGGKKVIDVLPPGSVDRRVVDVGSAEETVPVESGYFDDTPVLDNYAEGVLEFVETLDMKSKAPFWGGLLLTLLIVVVGLGLYALVVRKKE